MKKSLKFLLSVLLLNIFVFGALFAEGYHVCVASYKNLKNAETMVQKLEKQSMAAFISESKVKNQNYYRVLLSKEFKKIEDARKYRDEVKKYSFVKELGLKGFWVCEGKKMPVAKPAPLPPPPKQAPKPAPKPEPKVIPAPEPLPPPPAPLPEPIPEPPVVEVAPEPEPAPAPVPEVPVEAAEPAPEVPPVIIVEEPKTLDKNEKAVLSEETPYSVLVRSYKYNQFAENDSSRLKELGFEPYLLNTFDEKSFFAFNIHVGAFANREEAEALCSQFTDAGIADTQVSDFREIQDKIKKYDEVIANENVTFDDGRKEVPAGLSESVEKLVKLFPANKNFPIQDIFILDFDNYRVSDTKPDAASAIIDYFDGEEGVHAALLAKYRDELYRKEVSVFLADAENFPKDEVTGEVENMQFGANDGVFECELYENAGEWILSGQNIAQKLFVKVTTKDFVKEDFINFLIDSFSDGSLSLYPQMRRSFFVLPDKNPELARDFICFSFKKVAEDYASERGNVDWALPIVGHSLAKTYYVQNNNLFCFGFYDLDYDFNARNVHRQFMDAKNKVELSDVNQPVEVNGMEGWYLVNTSQKEVSFSTKSYVITIDSEPTSSFSKEDLVQQGKDLKIW
ncbi:SPOR domain-containing protein [Treponema ruminis]|uniref:SPOR domain-containing protein n=1 Tax=Treponema ruminis TaxID=744515 RepID=A0A7W8G6U6_9SPIR|nr:SPOR domain-containing protein [Treponema ruminis]MBB5224948.1 hypothetical protein [Treponema ruminis]